MSHFAHRRQTDRQTNSALAEVTQARSQPSDRGGGSFSSDVGLFQGLKIRVPGGCLGETSIFKVIKLVAVWF